MNAPVVKAQPSDSAFLKLFATGLIVWAIAQVALIGLAWPIAKPENISGGIIWAMSFWWIAFGVGALGLIIRGLVSRLAPGPALLAYLLPAAWLMALVGICHWVFPDSGFIADLLSYLPLVLAFYLFGLVWASLQMKGLGQAAFIRSVLPTILGGMIIVGMVAVPVFASNAFIYHKAFGLEVSNQALKDGAVIADAVLEIKKPGNYAFSSPRQSFNFSQNVDEPIITEYGKIIWGAAGEPKVDSTGSYPFQIRWEKNVPATETDLMRSSAEGDLIVLEVHDSSAEKKGLLFSLYASLPVKSE